MKCDMPLAEKKFGNVCFVCFQAIKQALIFTPIMVMKKGTW